MVPSAAATWPRWPVSAPDTGAGGSGNYRVIARRERGRADPGGAHRAQRRGLSVSSSPPACGRGPGWACRPLPRSSPPLAPPASGRGIQKPFSYTGPICLNLADDRSPRTSRLLGRSPAGLPHRPGPRPLGRLDAAPAGRDRRHAGRDRLGPRRGARNGPGARVFRQPVTIERPRRGVAFAAASSARGGP